MFGDHDRLVDLMFTAFLFVNKTHKVRRFTLFRISCLALADLANPEGIISHTLLFLSSYKYMFLTNVAPFRRDTNRLSNGIRFIAKKLSQYKEMIHQTHIPLRFVPI